MDVLTAALLEFGGGVATFTCGTRSGPDQRVHIVGTNGRIELREPSRPFNLPASGRSRLWLTRGGGHLDAGHTEAVDVLAADVYELQAAAFSHAVRTGDDPPISNHGSIANAAAIDAIRDASRRPA